VFGRKELTGVATFEALGRRWRLALL